MFTKAQYSALCSSSIVLEALSRELRSWVPWEALYADDLVIAESLEECVRRLLTWKEAMEKKGLRVNAGEMKIMICSTGLGLMQNSSEFPCAVCRIGMGSSIIFYNSYKHWVHKKCSGLKRLKKDPDYRCTRCQGTARPWTADHRPALVAQLDAPSTGDQEVAGSTPAEVGNILSWRLIMKYFLRSFSPFR